MSVPMPRRRFRRRSKCTRRSPRRRESEKKAKGHGVRVRRRWRGGHGYIPSWPPSTPDYQAFFAEAATVTFLMGIVAILVWSYRVTFSSSPLAPVAIARGAARAGRGSERRGEVHAASPPSPDRDWRPRRSGGGTF